MDSLGRLDQEKIREEDPENQGIGMNITGVLHYEDKVYPCEMDLVSFCRTGENAFHVKSGFWNW